MTKTVQVNGDEPASELYKAIHHTKEVKIVERNTDKNQFTIKETGEGGFQNLLDQIEKQKDKELQHNQHDYAEINENLHTQLSKELPTN